MHFAHPQYLLGLLAVAALAAVVVRSEVRGRRELAAYSAMLARLAPDYSPRRAALKVGLGLAALTALVIALAGPQWGSQLVTIERQGIDVVLAVDCSSSMNAKDVQPSRLDVAKRELGELVDRLDGNRLGLVGFAGTAFSFCPLTLDTSATHMFLDQLDTNSMPVPGTSLGDALRAALESFPAKDPNKKVIVLLTDGEDHHSQPLEVARAAARAGVTVYTVGIGNTRGEPIPDGETGYVRDSSGQVVMSRLDDATLQQIAKITGGSYVHVDGSQAESLQPVLTAIAGHERHTLKESVERRYVERFQMLVLLAIVMVSLERWLTNRKEQSR